MPESTISRLAKDPVSRRKFMALTGGSTALAAFLAACGSDKRDDRHDRHPGVGPARPVKPPSSARATSASSTTR